MARSAKQKANDKRLGAAAKARHAGKAVGGRGWSMAAKPGKKGGKARGKHKPSAATIRAMHAGAKRYWANRRGSGKPGKGKHIPLKQLKKNVVNLEKLIKVREKSPGSWS